MVRDRFLVQDDLALLTISTARDEAHPGLEPEFFLQPGTVTKVYEDEIGPILFARGSKALRLDLHYVDNTDSKRNMAAMFSGFDSLVAKAKENGFSEVIFCTDNVMLKRFCVKRFGFTESSGELRKLLT